MAAAGVEQDYRALEAPGRVALLRRELASPRPLTVPYADYDEETAGELEIFRAAATAHALYGQGAITVAIISKAASVSDLLELLVLMKEAGLYRPGHEPGATIMPVPLFETIDRKRTRLNS